MAKKVFTDESLETFVDEIKAYTDTAVSAKANSSHNHAASNITSGTLSSDRLPTVPVAKGGTGATTAAAALTNLGLTATAAELNKLDGVTATTAEINYLAGVTSNIQTQLNGKAASSHGTHVTYSTAAPAAAGTAAVGTATTVSRSDHVHPAQTSVSGNAGTATKLATARTIRTNLASTSTASFDGSSNVTPGVTGTLPVANGGTGATTAAAALTNLGITATAAELNKLDGVTATTAELNYVDGVTSNIQTQLDKKAASSHTHTASGITGTGYLNIHPENGPTIIPFINNDLAFLSKKGGSYSIYSTTSTDYTAASLTQGTLSISGGDSMFDGSPSYAMITTTGSFTAVIDLTLHKTFSYSNQFYIDFGASGWRANGIAVYVMNSATETKYTLKSSTTSNGLGNWFCAVSHSSTNSSGTTVQGFDRMRIVLSNFNNTTSSSGKRIAQVGLLNYGSAGATETFISRGGCSGIYGSLIPHTNNSIELGSSSKKWSNVYASQFTGALNGNANTATKLATARTVRTNLGSTSTASFDGSGNITPGVTGTLPIANGGTGATTAAGVLSALGITATAAELNKMDGVTATATEINYVDGVTSNIQTQLDSKASSSHSHSAMTGASSSAAGAAGLVPAPAMGNQSKYLRGDGTWATPTNTTYSAATTSTAGLMSASDKSKLDGIASGANLYSHPAYTAKGSGLYKVTVDATGHVSAATAVTKSDITALGIPGSDTNTTYSAATTSAAGLMSAADKTKLDGIATGANAYSHPTTAGNKHIPSGGSSGQILRWSADGTAVWGADNNTTYSAATQSAQGLMSAADKTKLDGIASGANAYSLPTASSSTLGGVKTTSTVTSASGYTACPIISGVPYYKDTNTTYSLSSFGVTATAAELNALDGITATVTELNYCDGVTSNIQTQLNGKASTSVATTSANGLMSSADKTKLNNTNIAYGTCSTAAATAAKVITVSGNTNWALTAGSFITVLFTNTNTASNPTFNVNGTGAKNVFYANAQITTSSLSYAGYKNRPMNFMYDGTQYIFIGWGVDNNTQSTTNSTNTSSKIFLVGATSQGSNKTTYSHDTAYVDTDGCLYSNSTKVSVEGHAHAASDITSGTLGVARGGTGATTFTSGRALIGAGTGAVTTRAITNNTATSTAVTASTNLVTMNTLRYAINRTTSVAAADTNYTTLMARGSSLNSTETDPAVNGAIAWTYE